MAGPDNRPTDDQLLDYVAGRATPEARRRIEAAAAEDPEVAADIALMQGVRAVHAGEEEVQAPGSLGWARLSRALEAEAPAPGRRVVTRILPFAATAAAAVLVWQVAITPLLTGRSADGPGYVPVGETPGAGFRVTVGFDPSATEADIRALLLDLGAEVTGGPSAIGLWQIGFADAAARAAAVRRLDQSSLVESVQVD